MGQGSRAKPKRLGEKLLGIRNSLGLSQNGIARRMGMSDVLTQSNVSEFESGRREPSLLVLLQYARVGGVTIDILADDMVDLPESPASGKSRKLSKKSAQRKSRKK